MERVNRILKHENYRYHINQNKKAERERLFCKHDMSHNLDVARIAVILNMKEHLLIDEEVIYAAALLHDVGKHMQYKENVPHEEGGVRIAPMILEDSGFTYEESEMILNAIANHRNEEVKDEPNLNGLLYRADKLSRPCFACEMSAECNWKGEKKNSLLKY